jgi:capsid protein
MTEAVMIGRVKAPGFFDDPLIRKAWLGSLWSGAGQGQIDPVKETKAALMRIKGNLSTYEDEYLALSGGGGDWEKSIVRLSRQNRRLGENNLPTSESIKDTGEPGDTEGGEAAPGEEEGTQGDREER